MQAASFSMKGVDSVGQGDRRHGDRVWSWIEELIDKSVVFGVVVILILLCCRNVNWMPIRRSQQKCCGLDGATACKSNVDDFADLAIPADFAAQPKAARAGPRAHSMEKTALGDIMKLYAENGKLDEMAQLFEEVEKRFSPFLGLFDYHAVIVQLARRGDPWTAHRLLRRCTELGFRPRRATYNTVIHSYAKKASVTNAMEVLTEMELARVEFDKVTYTGIMDAWAHAGAAGKAQEWMEKMLEAGLNPDFLSFSIVLRACATVGLQEDLDMWFERSQELGVELNEATFESVVRSLAGRSDAAGAMKWLAAMCKQNMKPSFSCCKEVLASIFKCNDVELADRLMDCMRAVEVTLDSAFYSQAVLLAVQTGHGDKAQRWADDCAKRNGKVSFAARRAIREAGLTIPKFGKAGKEDSVDRDAEVSCGISNLVRSEDSDNAKVHQQTSEEARQAARKAAIGKRFSGTIKDFFPRKFGYITCPAIHDLFHSDVFIGRRDNPQMFAKGQRVSFTLRVDDYSDRPRAADILGLRSSSSR